MVQRPVRRMPNVEEFPAPAQKALKARHGEAPSVDLAAQKKKVGFLERLSNVARGRKDEEDAAPVKREPEFGAPRPAKVPSKSADAAPKGLKIERPGADPVVAALPRSVEVEPKIVSMETREPIDESLEDDDLEIPAFLRRRAN
jgi:cell division protein FtsZ